MSVAYLPISKEGGDMRTYTVYRIDYLKNKTVKIGKLLDRRGGERLNNAADMLRLAQIKYPTSSNDSHIFILKESSTQNILLGDV
jgi:hypothetical protein